MKKICTLMLLAAMLYAVAGCKSHSGTRDYIPGKGWVPND